MHSSIKADTPCELINIVPLNPLISKCQIKVCYVGEDPNRNGSIITKDVATEMARSLPGSPIVGHFNKEEEDFEEHNKLARFEDGQFILEEDTRPYGFVDLGAKVWFQKFIDDGTEEREYLVTEGYLWTGQYPECARCLTEGNNQSMELDKNLTKGNWTKLNNTNSKFFIINEAIISKLCILGQDYEPCFEGASITKPVEFSLNETFKNQLFSLMEEMKKILDEGGKVSMFNTYSVEIGDALWCALSDYLFKTYPEDEYCSMYSIRGIFEDEDTHQKFAILRKHSDNTLYRMNFDYTGEEGLVPSGEMIKVEETYIPVENMLNEEAVAEFEKSAHEFKEEEKEDEEEICPECGELVTECKCGEKDGEEEKKKEYSLEEIPEYVELSNQFSALQASYEELKTNFDSLTESFNVLAEFKAAADKKEKEEMINKFFMLSEEDKKDVVENIDTYSLEEIEAKLSIICVRNKVSFDLDDDKNEDPTTYNLNGGEITEDDCVPSWVKAVIEVEKSMN